MAMPLSIVGNNFTLAWEERAKERVIVRIQRLCIEREISLAGVQDLFDSADSDQTGMLGYLEFCAFLRKLGLDLPPSQMRHMFRMFDEASNGATRRARTHRGRLHCTPPARPPPRSRPPPTPPRLRRDHPLRVLPPRLPRSRRRAPREGGADRLDTHGTPRLLSDAESNSAKSKRSKRKTGKDDAEVGTPPRRPAHPAQPARPVTRAAKSASLPCGRLRPRRRRRYKNAVQGARRPMQSNVGCPCSATSRGTSSRRERSSSATLRSAKGRSS